MSSVKFENVSKVYKLGQICGWTLREDIQSYLARLLGKEDPNIKIGQNYKESSCFYALKDINLTIPKGQTLGLIGRNGAGKSTLLKILTKITTPSSGRVLYNGKITSMLEVGTGFHGDLTGKENIYMNGAILGMTKSEINKKLDEIIEFSEVKDFIDTPVKRYSSGMYVKLAFSVAAHLDSEIMIMDEVLAVGDVAFQKKCINKMREEATNKGRTVIYVSHNMDTIRNLCDRCVVLNCGEIFYDGDVETGIKHYIGAV